MSIIENLNNAIVKTFFGSKENLEITKENLYLKDLEDQANSSSYDKKRCELQAYSYIKRKEFARKIINNETDPMRKAEMIELCNQGIYDFESIFGYGCLYKH